MSDWEPRNTRSLGYFSYGVYTLKAEYDFSRAERGKFYQPDAVFSVPAYLAPDVHDFLSKLADQKQVDVQDLVNDWLRLDMNLIQSAQ